MGGAKFFGVFRVKNHDFTPKNLIFSNFRGGAGCPPPLPCIRPWPRVFTNQWWRQIRRPFICHFAIWLFLPLVVCSHILHTVVPITVTLQSSTSWDLIDVCEWMSNLDSTFWDWEKWNQFIIVYNTLYDEAIDLAEQCCVVSSKPRTTGRQRNRANSQVADNKDYWRIILYY